MEYGEETEPMGLRVAFIGFQHGHIIAMYRLLAGREDTEIVAACEEDPAARASLEAAGVTVTHDAYARMLSDTECDVIACGDYFAIRGQRILDALERGCHVIGDKPLCTSLLELDRIKALATAKNRRVGCMLDLCDLGPYIALRAMIKAGRVGEVHTITFLGQHPLLYGKRPPWYFQPGKHGGSINDIAVHGIDSIPWLTSRKLVEVTAARAWCAGLPQHPEFQNGAVLMLRMDNNGAVLGDVSYLSSDRHGYRMPPYWRYTIAGAEGVIETSCNARSVTLWRHDTEAVVEEPAAANRTGGYFEDFLRDVSGNPNPAGLTTPRVIESTRMALQAQQAADSGVFPCPLG